MEVKVFEKSGVPKILESGSVFDVYLVIEVIVDGRVDRDDFLQVSTLSSGRLVSTDFGLTVPPKVHSVRERIANLHHSAVISGGGLDMYSHVQKVVYHIIR